MSATNEPPEVRDVAFKSNRRRSCTDFICSALYLASVIGCIVIGVLSVKQGGHPARITHGINWKGQVCGFDANVTDLPYSAWVAYPPLAKLDAPDQDCGACDRIFTCIENCNQTMYDNHIINHYKSKPFLHFCIPSENEDSGMEFYSLTHQTSRIFVDLYTTRYIILSAAFISLAVSFVYLWLNQRFAGLMVYGAIILAIVGAVGVTILLFLESINSHIEDPASSQYIVIRILGILLASAIAIFIIFMYFIRRQIGTAIRIIKVASKALISLPFLTTFPIFPILVGIAYFALFVIVTILIASVWNLHPAPMPEYIMSHSSLFINESFYQQISWNQNLKNSFGFLFFQMLWTSQCLIYFTYLVVAATVARRYFKHSRKQRGTNSVRVSNERCFPDNDLPIMESVWTTMRYHCGTLAFGGLIIPILKTLRAISLWAERGIVKHRKNTDIKFLFCLPNHIGQTFFSCLSGALGCCAGIMKHINQYAFIWTGITGDNFVKSVDNSFQLIWEHLGDVAVTNMVGASLMIVGKVCISCASTAICALIIQKLFVGKISSIILPLVVIFLLTYLVAACFMTVLETTIDATFFSVLLEEHMDKKRLTKEERAVIESRGIEVMSTDLRN